MKTSSDITNRDIKHLSHCFSLAEEAFNAGDEPFGSILVSKNDEVIAEARNRVNEITKLSHPKIELAQWAVANLCEEERKTTSMNTSGEHCPICAAAHGWAGLGTIIFLSSAEQLTKWLQEIDSPAAPIHFTAVKDIIKSVVVRGPDTGVLLQEIKNLQIKYHKNQ